MGQFDIKNVLYKNKEMPLDIQKFASNGVHIVQAYETGVDVANNLSYVYLEIQASTNSTTYNNTGGAYVNIIATSPNNSYGTGNVHFNISKNTTKTVWSGTLGPFYHNADGSSGNVTVTVTSYITSSTKPSTTGSVALTHIQRKPTFTENPSITNVQETSFTFKWGAVNINSNIYYSLDNANWVHVTSDYTTVSGLAEGQYYTLYVQARNQADNSQSSTATAGVQLYWYPHPQNPTDFTIGDGATVYLYNPLGRNCTLQLISNNDGSVIGTYSGTYAGAVNGEFKTADAIDRQYKSIPNSQSGTYYAKVTYGSSVHVNGSKTYYIRTAECYPTFNLFTFEDINEKTLALTGNNQSCIKGYSTIKATVPVSQKASAKKYASIKKYRLTIGDKTDEENYSDAEDVSMQIENAPSGTFTVYAIDTRELSTPVQLLATNIINYEVIKKGDTITAIRTNEDGEVVGTSELVKLSFNGSIWYNEDGSKGNFGVVTNSIKSAKYRFKPASQSEWTEENTYKDITVTLNADGTFTFDGFIEGDTTEKGFNIDNAYNIEVVVEDELSSTTYTANIGSGTPHVAYSRNGVSIMGKYDEDEGGKFQVGGIPIEKINLIGKYELQQTSDIFTINNLDLKDGLYEMLIDVTATGSTVLQMKLNNTFSHTQQLIEGTDGSVISANNGGASRIGTVNVYSSFISVELLVKNEYSRVISHGGNSNKINICIFETKTNGNINTIQIQTTAQAGVYMYSGTTVYIYKKY